MTAICAFARLKCKGQTTLVVFLYAGYKLCAHRICASFTTEPLVCSQHENKNKGSQQEQCASLYGRRKTTQRQSRAAVTTFDVTMELSLRVEVIQSAENLSDYCSNIRLIHSARFELDGGETELITQVAESTTAPHSRIITEWRQQRQQPTYNIQR